MKQMQRDGIKKLVNSTNYTYNAYVYKLEKMRYNVSILDELYIEKLVKERD